MTATGTLEVTFTRAPGPPPSVSPTSFRVSGGRLGDSTLDAPVPEEWASVLAQAAGKRVEVTYTVGPPLVVSQVKVLA